MKTFLGNMHDYIYQSEEFATKIIENRKEITKSYLEAFNEKIEKVIITGAGTSNFSPQTSRVFMEKVTNLPTYVVLPTAIVDGEYLLDEKCLVIGISATGSSACTIAALEYAKERGATAVAFTNEMDSPFAQKNQYKVFIDHGVEDCSPKSKSYICELVTLSLCSIELALHKNIINEEEYIDYIQRLEKTVHNLTNIATKSDAWYRVHSDEFKQCERMLVVGYGAN